MFAIRTIKRTNNNKLIIDIPDNLNNKDLEIIILPIKKSEKEETPIILKRAMVKKSSIALARALKK